MRTLHDKLGCERCRYCDRKAHGTGNPCCTTTKAIVPDKDGRCTTNPSYKHQHAEAQEEATA